MPKIVTPVAEKDIKAASKKEYLLVRGKHFGRDNAGNEVEYEVGEMVPLTDAQYEAFNDKFEAPGETSRKAEEAIARRRKAEEAKEPPKPNQQQQVVLTDEEKKAGWTIVDGKKVAPPQK